MTHWPETTHAWRRLQLTLAEWLVWRVWTASDYKPLREHGWDVAEAIRTFRNRFYRRRS